MSPEHGKPGSGLLLFFRVDDFDLALQRAPSGHSARRGATRESEHSNQGVFAPRSRRILRYEQCALCGLKKRLAGHVGVSLRVCSCYIVIMEITLKIPEEIAAQARARGMRVEEYIEEILAQRLAARPSTARLRSPSEIRAWLDSLAQFSEKIPPLPETLSREWIYQDHN